MAFLWSLWGEYLEKMKLFNLVTAYHLICHHQGLDLGALVRGQSINHEVSCTAPKAVVVLARFRLVPDQQSYSKSLRC